MKKRIEIIVVAGIGLVIIGLLAPLITNLRYSASRLECQNNLMAIGEGLHTYHIQHKRFPYGIVQTNDLSPEQRLSWFVEIMPYIGKYVDFWDLDLQQSWDSNINRTVVSNPVLPFICPESHKQSATSLAPFTNYVGISGIGEGSAAFPINDWRVGVFGYSRSCNYNDIKDGIQRTMMVIETGSQIGPWASGGTSTVRGLKATPPPYLGVDGQFYNGHFCKYTFFSNPTYTTNILFVDGSVHSLKDSIAANVFEAMATIAGEE